MKFKFTLGTLYNDGSATIQFKNKPNKSDFEHWSKQSKVFEIDIEEKPEPKTPGQILFEAMGNSTCWTAPAVCKQYYEDIANKYEGIKRNNVKL